MAHFLVFATDHPPHSMALRETHRTAHRDYVLANDGTIRLAGAMTDEAGNQCGSVYSFEADSEDDVRRWLEAEAFVANGIYARIEIVRWSPRLNRLPPQEW